MRDPAPEVFISHSSRDHRAAERICDALERQGIPCWIAPRDVPAGHWDDAIMCAIETASSMVLVFSRNADGSQHVRDEVVAFGIKPIIPVRIEDVPPSGGLRLHIDRLHWVDAFDRPLEAMIPDLVRRLKEPHDPEPALLSFEATTSHGQTVQVAKKEWRGSGRWRLIFVCLFLLGAGIGTTIIPNVPKPRLAVAPFTVQTDLPEHLQDAGKALAEVTEAQLDQEAYRLAHRMTWPRDETPLPEENRAPAAVIASFLTKVLAARVRYWLTGTLQKRGQHYYIESSLIDAETQQTRAARARFDILGDVVPVIRELLAQMDIAMAPEPRNQSLFLSGVDLIDARNPRQAFTMDLRTHSGKLSFQEGEELVLELRANRDCYVLVTATNSAGEITLLLPNAYQLENRLQAGQWTRVPAESTPVSFTVRPPFGTDVIKAIATTEPLALRDMDSDTINAEKFPVIGNARGIALTPQPTDRQPLGVNLQERLHSGAWATAALVLTTQPRNH